MISVYGQWSKELSINLIKEIVNKYFDRNSNMYNIIIQFKTTIFLYKSLLYN
jgi:hypothetical protein